MDTVTPTEFGSVDYFAERLRSHAHHWSDVRLHALEYVKVLAGEHRSGAEVEDIKSIRNALAAVEIVHAEQAAAR